MGFFLSKGMSKVSPTSRTLQLLKKENKLVDIVEKWNSFTQQRKDVFGFIDIIALDPEKKETWGIQCTSTGNMNARVKKILTECRDAALIWLKAGNHIEVIGWSKTGPAGKRKLWNAKRRTILLEDFTQPQ